MDGHDGYAHALDNAKGWYEELRDLYREQGDEIGDAERQRIDEMPLSIECRSAWSAPSMTGYNHKSAEYRILLTTGGPALQVWGELDEHGEPDNAQLQMQDWGVPWREVWPCEVSEMDEARAVLLWFARNFYFGG